MSSHQPSSSTVAEITRYSVVTGTRAANIGGVTVTKQILQYLHWSQCRPMNPVPAQLQK